VWYTGQLYTMFFLEKMLGRRPDGHPDHHLAADATPFFLVFGVCRTRSVKPIILTVRAGCCHAVPDLPRADRC
jgi:hypothetical protein